MLRFSLRALFFVVLFAAVACTVLLVFPPWLRVAALFVGVLAMPGPLMVLYRRGGAAGRSFALGGLTAYLAWFLVAGLPSGVSIATTSGPFAESLVSFTARPAEETFASLIISGYPFLGLLYAPWLAVPLAGLLSLFVLWFCPRTTSE